MWKKATIALSIVISLGLIWGALSFNGKEQSSQQNDTQSIRQEDGAQVIHILARGGYSPQQITAKAGVPTILEVETKGTYDCSAAFTIPQLSYQKHLPPSGVTKIEIPSTSATGSLTGLCAMGMYSFSINFES